MRLRLALSLILAACAPPLTPVLAQRVSSQPRIPIRKDGRALQPRGQGTAGDTTHAAAARASLQRLQSFVLDSLRIEASRSAGPRKTVVLRLKARGDTIRLRLDSLEGALLVAPPAPPPPPPAPVPSAPTVARVQVTSPTGVTSIAVGATVQLWGTPRDSTGKELTAIAITWTSSASSIATVSAGLVAGVAAGTTTITAAAGTASGSIVITVTGAQPPPPPPPPPPPGPTAQTTVELPRVTPTATTTAPTNHVPVPAGWPLQSALDAVQYGDDIVLDSSGTWTGNFVLRAKPRPAGAWITIRSSGSLLPAGTRVDGRAQPLLARLLSPGGGASPALRTEPGASGYRLESLEVSATAGALATTSLLNLGDGSGAQNSLAMVPQDLVVSHLYVHGTPTLALKRCIALHSGSTAIVDSWLSECHDPGNDAQAIGCYNGPGPYLIENNYLEGSTENVMCGGADPGIVNNVPSDITIRRNHITKPLTWKGIWTVKNLLEIKAARRVLIEGNVFENQQVAAQTFAMILKSTNQAGACTACVTTDVTVRFNIFRNIVAGINVAAHPETFSSGTTARIAITDNLFDGLGSVAGTTDGHVFQLLGSKYGPLAEITIARNAVRHNANVTISTIVTMDSGGGPAMAGGLTITDNLATAGGSSLPIKGNTTAGTASLQLFAPGYVYGANAIIGPTSATKSQYPASTLWPALATDVWPGWANGDYTPAPTYAALGPDLAKLRALTNGVVLP